LLYLNLVVSSFCGDGRIRTCLFTFVV